MCLCVPLVCLVPMAVRKGEIRSQGNKIMYGYGVPCEFWAASLGPLQEQLL